jgi:hypothetical protein
MLAERTNVGSGLAVVKTTVSIRDDTFAAAEQLAHELHLSRSELYSRALETLLDLRRERELREQITAAVLATPAVDDEDGPFLDAGSAGFGALIERYVL